MISSCVWCSIWRRIAGGRRSLFERHGSGHRIFASALHLHLCTEMLVFVPTSSFVNRRESRHVDTIIPDCINDATTALLLRFLIWLLPVHGGGRRSKFSAGFHWRVSSSGWLALLAFSFLSTRNSLDSRNLSEPKALGKCKPPLKI